MTLDFGLLGAGASGGIGIKLGGGSVIRVSLDETGDTDSIQDGINLLPKTGGTVYISEGTYKINASITFPNNNITLIGSGAGTIIEKQGAFDMMDIRESYISIDSIHFDGNSQTGHGIYIYGSDARHIWITNCVVQGQGGGDGILCSTNSGEITIWKCHIYGNSSEGITLINSGQVSILQNRIVNNTASGIRTAEP